MEKLVREGNYKNIEKLFSNKPFYIMSVAGKMKWGLLWAKKQLEEDQLKEAYEVYVKLLSLPLFEEEENAIKLKQVLALLLLGDTTKAESIFERTNNKLNESNYCESLYLQSIFDERKGKFEEARRKLISAVSEYNNDKDIQLAEIYNDLGRMEKMLGNKTNVFHYYSKSVELACHYKDKYLIHIVFPNIIDAFLQQGDNNKADLYLGRYSELIDNNNTDDILKFNNYCLEHARQTKDNEFLLETLVRGRMDILPKISAQEQLNFEVSELRIRWNCQRGWDEKLFWLKHHLPDYLKLGFPIRYYTLKEIFIVLRELAITNNLGPFLSFFGQLLEFMERSKEDIDRYLLLELPDYCADERCFWEKEKAFLRKVQKMNETQEGLKAFCEGIFEHLRNIKQIHLLYGNPLPAIESDLNIADECMGLIQQIRDTAILPYLRETMKEHINNACIDLEGFRCHPVSNLYFLRIARYALFLDDKKKAKEYFDVFVESKISVHHYAAWIQLYHQELLNALH